jgi:methyltransferase (TIGR00027 family)
MGEQLPEVSLTAFGVAAGRAAESARPDRLFSDPFAARFLAAANSERPDEDRRLRKGLTEWITVRTRFLDDVALGAVAAGARQVVILGAGLDARAFRLAWPEGLRLYELDMPGVLGFKERVIEQERWRPACERVVVPVDLSEDWESPLKNAGLDASAPVVWIAEGLLAYLPAAASDRLIAGAAQLSPLRSRFGLTLASARRLEEWRRAHPEGSESGQDYVALWRSANAERAVEWLAASGWRAQVFDVAERSAAYGRPLSPPSGAGGENRARLVEAERV